MIARPPPPPPPGHPIHVDGAIAQALAAGDAYWPEGVDVSEERQALAESWWHYAGELRAAALLAGGVR